MKYSVLYPLPESIEGRSFILPGSDEILGATYEEVATGDTKLDEPMDALEELFVGFNIGNDAQAAGVRSMSVGDVVVLDGLTAWICLAVGWGPVIVTRYGEGWKVELLAAGSSS